jgi:hypothetical protein
MYVKQQFGQWEQLIGGFLNTAISTGGKLIAANRGGPTSGSGGALEMAAALEKQLAERLRAGGTTQQAGLFPSLPIGTLLLGGIGALILFLILRRK